MKKFLLAFSLILCLACMAVGAEEYHITTPEELYNVRNDLAGTYFLDNDIDLSGYASWEPIGSGSKPFTGTFDGQGHEITGLNIDVDVQSESTSRLQYYIGLFGYVQKCTVKNVGVDVNIDVNITSQGEVYTCVGGLIGYNVYGSYGNEVGSTIENCYSSGNIIVNAESVTSTCDIRCGGLIGVNPSGEIFNSHSSVNVNSTSVSGGLMEARVHIGGLIGNSRKTVENCYATGNVTAEAMTSHKYGDEYLFAGGLIGVSDEEGITKSSYATGNVEVTTSVSGDAVDAVCPVVYVGGLCGANNWGTVSDCYAIGDVSVNSETAVEATVGGLMGSNWRNGIVSNCYALGQVRSNAPSSTQVLVGGAIGGAEGTITNCYHNSDLELTDTVSTGLTTSQMKQQSSFIGFDFETIWAIAANKNSGYPYLQALPVEDGGNTQNSPEILTFTAQKSGVSALITLAAQNFSSDYAIFIAGYDTEGRLVSVYSVSLQNGIAQPSYSVTTETKFKVFAFESSANLKPVCASKSSEL